MSKRRLPPIDDQPRTLYGPKVEGYTVASWCPTPDASGPPTAVALVIETEAFEIPAGTKYDIVLRLKTPQAADTLIQSVLRHKRQVWPDAP